MNDYHSLYSKEDLTDLRKVLNNFARKGQTSVSNGNWKITSGNGQGFTVSYKNEPILDCSHYELIPYTEDTSKIMSLLPAIDTITEEYDLAYFRRNKYHILSMKSAVISNYEMDGEPLIALIDEEDFVLLGKRQNYDNHGNYNDQTGSSLFEVSAQDTRFFHLLYGDGVTETFEGVEHYRLFGGLRNIAKFLEVEKSLFQHGVQKTHDFCFASEPLTQDSFNAYIDAKHPEFKAYKEYLDKLYTDNTPRIEIPAVDTQIAKAMRKDRYSSERIESAIAFGSPYINDEISVKTYTSNVLKGKYKPMVRK